MRKQRRILQSNIEETNIEKYVAMTSIIPGDCIEVGVFDGGSAEYILEKLATDKKLYLFDPFDKFIDLTPDDPLGENFFSFSDSAYKDVVEFFSFDSRVEVIKGYFPGSARPRFDDARFSFAHLDIDTYTATIQSLEYIYPRMNPGGIILFHDYIHVNLPIKKVCDLFFADKPEKVIETGTSQGYIVKQ